MAKPERRQVSTDAAEFYEFYVVPAVLGPWASPVSDAVRIEAGNRVLDVACGTGALAREALTRVGQQGQVVGLDLDEGMLAVAARTEPKVEWRQGDAGALPFEDESFDVVVSQFALMYFPDRVTALREMWRVLVPNGRLAVATWASIDRARGYRILAEIATKHCEPEVADMLAAPHVLGDKAQLAELFVEARISGARVTLHEGSVRFASVKELVRIEVKGHPPADHQSDEAMETLAVESESALAEFVQPSGEIVMPLDAHIVTAEKA